MPPGRARVLGGMGGGDWVEITSAEAAVHGAVRKVEGRPSRGVGADEQRQVEGQKLVESVEPELLAKVQEEQRSWVPS